MSDLQTKFMQVNNPGIVISRAIVVSCSQANISSLNPPQNYVVYDSESAGKLY